MNIYESWIVTKPIAHRGLFNDEIPENSIAAFKNAIKNKMPIEIDVTCLADETPVVFHDEKLARMTGKNGFISNCNYEDIANLTLKGTKERIPTFEQALEAIAGKVPILIEIKNFGKVGSFEKNIWKILQKYDGEYAVESYNPYTLEWFKNNAPKIKRGQTASFFKNKEIIGLRKFSLKRMHYNKKISEPSFIIYKIEDMPNRFVRKYTGKIPILVYTVRSKDQEIESKEFSDNFIFDSYVPDDYLK